MLCNMRTHCFYVLGYYVPRKLTNAVSLCTRELLIAIANVTIKGYNNRSKIRNCSHNFNERIPEVYHVVLPQNPVPD